MGNKQSQVFKHLQIPNLSFEKLSTKMNLTCGDLKQLLPQDLDHSFLQYKTFGLKTRKQVQKSTIQKVYKLDSLRIMTYNVWFQQHNIKNRIQAILQIIRKSDADIICLQEVTQQFMQALWENAEYLCQKGQLFLPRVPMHWYDTMILSRFPIQFYQIPFKESTMARKLLMGICQVTDKNNQKVNLSINCVHLQSLQNQKLRTLQLQYICELNQKLDVICLLGDLNFGDNWPQDKIVQTQYIDVWKLCKKQNCERWTMPRTPQFRQWRPDHILIKNNKIANSQFSKPHNLQAKIQRIGVFPIPPYQDQNILTITNDSIVRTPSDHMGLLANLRF